MFPDTGEGAVSNSIIPCDSYYFSGLLLFAGYSLIEVRVTSNNQTTYVFEMEQVDYDDLRAAFESEEGQAVTNIRAYCTALKVLDTHQKEARRDRDGMWCRPLEEKHGDINVWFQPTPAGRTSQER
jgi:hypothetical protein